MLLHFSYVSDAFYLDFGLVDSVPFPPPPTGALRYGGAEQRDFGWIVFGRKKNERLYSAFYITVKQCRSGRDVKELALP